MKMMTFKRGIIKRWKESKIDEYIDSEKKGEK